MASGFFALLDDIASLMDDVVVMSKITTKKTAGILGDDLAVNAEKASGFVSSRELPVLWAIAKGSFVNKLIILPVAFVLSYYLPWAISVLLLLGGLYLAYEGAEKIYEFLKPHDEHTQDLPEDQAPKATDVLAVERKKIKSAILTDFILSIEIIIIALGSVTSDDITVRILVVSFVAIIATIGVYGIVALIVRMDDLGLKFIALSRGKKNIFYHLGSFLVRALPKTVKGLSIVGTLALLLVSGGIFEHQMHDQLHFLEVLPVFLREFLLGLVVGFFVLLVITLVKSLFNKAH